LSLRSLNRRSLNLKILNRRSLNLRILNLNRVVDSLVGDETGTILLRTMGMKQAKRVKVWSTIRLRNARTYLFNNHLRLKVQNAEDIEDAPTAKFVVKEQNNVSLH
jgi:ssDNA-binding replication factor A large subunit